MNLNLKKIYALSIVFLVIDQFIKMVVSTNFKLNETFIVIKKFFYITLVHNDGAAFSLFEGGRIFFILIGIITIILISLFINSDENSPVIIYSLLMGGILGNVLDRILHGYVIDYISFKFLNYNFPIFNFADICIVVSIVLIFAKTLQEDLWK